MKCNVQKLYYLCDFELVDQFENECTELVSYMQRITVCIRAELHIEICVVFGTNLFWRKNMQLNSVVIRTENMEQSLEFYEKILGLTFETMMSAAPGKQIAFLYDAQSNGRLELIHNDLSKVKKENSISLTFIVDQISETEKYLRSKNVRIIMQPRTVKDGKKMLTAVDPNGIEIDFIEL